MHIFLLFVLLVAPVTAVPGCHGGRDKDHRRQENCTAAGFTGVPTGLEPATKVLLFPQNLFSSLSWSSFQIFTEIYEIDLTGNKVPELTPSSAPILPSLSVLRLGSNRLTSLPDGSFSACPALTELYLEGNALVSLSDNTFSGLSKLEILDLSSNRIQVLPQLMLQPLAVIETLDIENNKVLTMPDGWFGPKEEVPYLFLSANPWACSCSLGYLRRYIDEYDYNVYVRDGPILTTDSWSVVCDSPLRHKATAVLNLEESELCPPEPEHPIRGDGNKPMETVAPTVPVLTNTPIHITTTAVSMTTAFPTTPPIPSSPLTPTFVEWSDHSTNAQTDPLTAAKTTTTTTKATTTTPMATTTTPMATTTTTKATTTTPMATTTTTKATTTTPMATTTTPIATTTTPMATTTTPIATTTTTKATTTTTKATTTAGDDSVTGRGAGVFCFWLFASCSLLCLVSAVAILATVARMVFWYRRVYKPIRTALTRRQEVVRLLTREGRDEGSAVYRSVLYVHREGGVEEERGETEGVYRNTMYRVMSKEEEVGGRKVMEECQVSGEERGRRMGDSRKRYSVILREEAGGRGEKEWVVGGVGGGGEEARSSWGEWLTHYLPSMPWGVAPPPEGEAAQ
ncbi:hypothetical protein OYC64_001262 [Pagothenia borchgrevinki]|uniref:LRRCT domain-containing protein n=1 Tax=Pagothenia borchgrevinki TaxID=8213 RepID=A0ABD2GAK0_PAGBO